MSFIFFKGVFIYEINRKEVLMFKFIKGSPILILYNSNRRQLFDDLSNEIVSLKKKEIDF